MYKYISCIKILVSNSIHTRDENSATFNFVLVTTMYSVYLIVHTRDESGVAFNFVLVTTMYSVYLIVHTRDESGVTFNVVPVTTMYSVDLIVHTRSLERLMSNCFYQGMALLKSKCEFPMMLVLPCQMRDPSLREDRVHRALFDGRPVTVQWR